MLDVLAKTRYLEKLHQGVLEAQGRLSGLVAQNLQDQGVQRVPVVHWSQEVLVGLEVREVRHLRRVIQVFKRENTMLVVNHLM